LASKHIIYATISARPTSSMRNIIKVLGVHPKNISIAMQRCKITNDVSDALWSLFIGRRMIDDCTSSAKTTTLAWRASKTRMSFNKADVTIKHLDARM
jgi:hypothetical protein